MNIVFILTDDQGVWSLGCNGNQEIVTENIDQLARNGMRFNNFFCVTPVCSPARASILTGRIPSSHGIHDFIAKGNGDSRVSGYGDRRVDRPIEYLKGMTGYTELLKEAGYNCGFCGKWHLGNGAQPQKGFDYWYAYCHGGSIYTDWKAYENGVLTSSPKYDSYIITDKAVEFIENQNSSHPFYLSVHYTAPHHPWAPECHPDDLRSIYKDCEFNSVPLMPPHPHCRPGDSTRAYSSQQRREHLTGYYAAITGVDRCVGRIIDKLEELNFLSNTLIIFTSDNGMNMGHHGIWGKGNGTFPMNMYDTSVKVPFIVSGPTVPCGSIENKLHSHYDVFPTLIDYTEIDCMIPKNLPGKSFASLLRGETGCSSDLDHIVVFDEYGPVRMIRGQRWKYVHRYPYGPHEFYDLVNDPDECFNLIDDKSCSALIDENRKHLIEWFNKYVDPDFDGAKLPVTGLGQTGIANSVNADKCAFIQN